jgi:type IV pilus assembly protein PilE
MIEAILTCQDQRPTPGDGRVHGAARREVTEPIIGSSSPWRSDSLSGRISARPNGRGFTLVELMLVVAVAGILSSVAYPSFMAQLQKIRRSDALVSLLQLQAAQERWRSNNLSYASLAEIAIGATSTAGHYALQVTAHFETGYEALATAQGAQANDTQCRHLRLRVEGGNLVQSSGPDAATSNPVPVNRQCWSA